MSVYGLSPALSEAPYTSSNLFGSQLGEFCAAEAKYFLQYPRKIQISSSLESLLIVALFADNVFSRRLASAGRNSPIFGPEDRSWWTFGRICVQRIP